MKKIIGKKINLRNLRDSDAQSIFENVNDKDIIKYTLSIPYPYKLIDAENFIQRVNQKNIKDFHFGIEDKISKNIIGMISLHMNPKTIKVAEVGYWLGKKYWGKGYMKEALDIVLDYGFNKLKLEKIYAGVFKINKKSQKRLEHAGFKQEGLLRKHYFRLGVWHDDVAYGLLKEEYENN